MHAFLRSGVQAAVLILKLKIGRHICSSKRFKQVMKPHIGKARKTLYTGGYRGLFKLRNFLAENVFFGGIISL